MKIVNSVFAIDQQGGKGGANYLRDVMCTLLSDSHGTPHAVAYDITGESSNSMKSPTPDSCFKARNVCRCIDGFCGQPLVNQGGTVVVIDKTIDLVAESRGAYERYEGGGNCDA